MCIRDRVRAEKADRISDELRVGDRPFEGLQGTFLSNFGVDQAEGKKQWNVKVLEGAHRVNLDAIRDGQSGLPDLALYRAKAKDTMSTGALNLLDDYMKSCAASEAASQQHLDALAEKEKGKQNDALILKYSIAAEKNPEKFLDLAKINAAAPELVELKDLQQIQKVAMTATYGKGATIERAQGFQQEVLNPLLESGQVIPTFSQF